MNRLRKTLDLMKLSARLSKLRPESRAFVNDFVQEAQVIEYLTRYSYVLNHRSQEPHETPHTDKIWQLWYQSIDNAPTIVRVCLDTVQEYSGGREVVLLDNHNIDNYVSIPGYIYDKKKTGSISNVNFADILRACLLAEHGGLWLDSTVMLTGPIPSYVWNSSLFCFSTTPRELRGVGHILASSWFIRSVRNHVIIKSMKELFFEYWRYENNCRHPYYFHLLFALAVSSNADCKNEWEKVPFFSNVPPHVLQMELFSKYSEERFEQIKQMSTIHKLTYYGGKEFDPEKKNTFYDVLVNEAVSHPNLLRD